MRATPIVPPIHAAQDQIYERPAYAGKLIAVAGVIDKT